MVKITLILLLAITPSLCAKIEFAGVFYLGEEGNFSLSDSESGQKSGWLQKGQSFRGHRIESYDRNAEVLSLVSPNGRLELYLRPSVVKADRVTIRGNLKIGAAQEVAIDNALIVVGEEAKFQIDENTWMKLKVERVEGGLLPGVVPGMNQKVVRVKDGLPPGSVREAVQNGEAIDGHPDEPQPEGGTEGPFYQYTMSFAETEEALSLQKLSATTRPGRGFMIMSDEYSFTYEP